MTTMTPLEAWERVEGLDEPGTDRRSGSGPRWIVVHGAVLLTAIVVLTVVAATGAGERSLALRRVTLQDAVLGEELQAAYTSLSLADNAVTTAFLLGPRASPLRDSLDDEYVRGIAEARAKVDSAVLGTGGDPRAVRASAMLDAYRGQVEAARALRRVNSAEAPVALRGATAVMRTDLLPLIDGRGSLLADVRARSTTTIGSASTFSWWVIGLGVLTLVLLARTQRLLAVRTRRRLNAGLLLAALAVAVVVAASVETVRAVRGDVAGAAAADGTAEECSQIANGARRAHSAETLWTVRLASDPKVLETVRRELAFLRGTTGVATTACGPVGAGIDTWERSLVDRPAVLAGRSDGFDAAVTIVAGDAPGTSGAAFRSLTADAGDAVARARSSVGSSLADAESGPARLLPVVVALGALAVLGVVGGLARSVRDYA